MACLDERGQHEASLKHALEIVQPLVLKAIAKRTGTEVEAAPTAELAMDPTELAVWEAPKGRRTTRAATAKVRKLFETEDDKSDHESEDEEANALDDEPHGCVVWACVWSACVLSMCVGICARWQGIPVAYSRLSARTGSDNRFDNEPATTASLQLLRGLVKDAENACEATLSAQANPWMAADKAPVRALWVRAALRARDSWLKR